MVGSRLHRYKNLMANPAPSHGHGRDKTPMTAFDMSSEEDIQRPKASSSPSLWSRIWNRPLYRWLFIGGIIALLALIIGLAAGLSQRSNNNSSSSAPDTNFTSTRNGCGTSHASGYSDDYSAHNLKSGQYIRNYTVQVPPNYNTRSSDPWPLIIDLHGSNSDPDQQHNNSMYWNHTLGSDYLVVYPQGVNQFWQGAVYAASSESDDLQFMTDLVRHLDAEYCLDENRLYVSGKSNGGGFADTLACSDHGDKFAAFAMASAALYTDLRYKDCNKSHPIMESHGLEDKTIPYEGQGKSGQWGPLPDVEEWVGWWARRDGCKKADEPVLVEERGYNHTSYSCEGFEDVVQHFAVEDLGHCWPREEGENYDAEKTRSCERDRSLDFTGEVLRFFGNWTLENGPKN